MDMKKVLFLSIIVLLVFSACEKDIIIDIPPSDPKLVIDARLAKDQVIEVSVGKSRHILSTVNRQVNSQENYVVKDAIPIVYENDTAIDTLVYVPSEYKYKSLLNKTIQAGYSYSIKVNAPGFKEVKSLTVVPSQSEIAEINRVKKARKNADGVYFDEITVKMDDPAESNFYLFRFYRSTPVGSYKYPIDCIRSADKDLDGGGNSDPFEGDNCLDGNNLLMNDKNFNGRRKQIKFFIQSGNLSEDFYNGRIYRPYLRVYRLTEDEYRFLRSFRTYDNTSDNPFAEPVNVYSNINNGYGIFSAYTVAVDTLQ